MIITHRFMECKDRTNRSSILLPYSFLPSMAAKKLKDAADKVWALVLMLNFPGYFCFRSVSRVSEFHQVLATTLIFDFDWQSNIVINLVLIRRTSWLALSMDLNLFLWLSFSLALSISFILSLPVPLSLCPSFPSILFPLWLSPVLPSHCLALKLSPPLLSLCSSLDPTLSPLFVFLPYFISLFHSHCSHSTFALHLLLFLTSSLHFPRLPPYLWQLPRYPGQSSNHFQILRTAQ